MKSKIWVIIVGIFLLALDVKIPVGEVYPAMLKEETLGEQLQGKIITNFIGSQPSIDIFSDLLGLVVLFVGCALLLKHSKQFIAAMLLIPIAAYLYIQLPLLPYHLDSRALYLRVAGYNFLLIAIVILIEYYVIHGIVKMTNCIQNQWNNNEMLGGWIIAMMSKGLLVGIDFFFGEHTFYLIYTVVMLAATVYYVNRLFKTLEFDPGTKNANKLWMRKPQKNS